MAKDQLWNACVDVFGYSPATNAERNLWRMLVSELREAGVVPQEVRRAARGYRMLFPTAALTPTAMLKHFSQALAEATPRPRLVLIEDDASQETVPPPAGLFDSWKAGNA